MSRLLCSIAASLLFGWVCIGCRSSGGVAGGNRCDVPVGKWWLSQLNGSNLKLQGTPWVRVESDGEIRGWAGVNQISSELDTNAARTGVFKLSPIIATRMAGAPEAMKLESEFLAVLQKAVRFSVENDVLELRDPHGATVAVLVCESP